MIEVFKTNINSQEQAKEISDLLYKNFPNFMITFDLNDCDRILRVNGNEFKSIEITNQLKSLGYFCEILKD